MSQIDENIIREFKSSLRFSLLTDNYGGWKALPPTFLEELCDRITIEFEDIVQKLELKLDHRECESEIVLLSGTIEDLEDREEKRIEKFKEFKNGLQELMEKVKL